ncbi:MAG: NAD(P)/FAD-dependent oxidoreductase [Gammaproteobacteria bacterium]|nr:NAD(P)/FAD-dependent oxidoreductase [Gammaproteobacteria bacterium]
MASHVGQYRGASLLALRVSLRVIYIGTGTAPSGNRTGHRNLTSGRYDVVIIGAGHNGLTCGAYLARAGLKTLVLERRGVIGGAAVTEEFAPGFRTSTFSYLMSLLHPKVIRDLELRELGLTVLPATDLFCPIGSDNHIIMSGDVARTAREFSRFSRHDGAVYAEFDAYLNEAADVVRELLFDTPIDPSRRDFKGLRELAAFAWKYRRIGGKFYRIVDLLTMSADDYLARWFEHGVTRAVLGYYCSIGTFAGPKTPGSAYVVLHHLMGEHVGAGGWGFIRAGMGAISEAIAAAGRQHGLETRTGADVTKIEVTGGRAARVVTATGDAFEARAVVSNVSCKVLFDRLVEPAELPPEFLKHIRGYRTFSTAFKINVAAEAPPRFTAFEPARCGFAAPNYVHIGPDVDYLQAAYEDACQGRWSRRPFVTAVVPTTVDDTLAPKGKHVINLFGGHAPYELKGATWGTERAAFLKNVYDTIDELAPGFSGGVIADQLLLPPDIERIINTPQGHIFHGELSLEQLFFQRPAPHYSDYRSPVRGLYQCGSSTHPGGGVSGIPGHNAAREILRDWKSVRA